MTVSFTTRNAGTAPVGPFRVNLFMAAGPNPPPAPDDGTGVGFKDFTGLAAGASLASTLIVNVPSSFEAGSYFLSAVVDAGNAIPEAGGNDGPAVNGRVAIKTITVIRPDLVVSAFNGPVRAARGGTVAVTATVKNLAAAPAAAPASSLKFYLSDDQTLDSGDVELSPARAISILGPGAVSAAATTLAIPASVTTGNKFILARADALDGVTEAQEGNNVTARAIEIGDFADLQITAVAGPVAAGTGRPMTVSFTTRNAGVAPVGPFRVNLFLAPAPNPAPAPGDGTGVGFKDFPGLAAGASLASTLVVDLPASFTAGSYFLSAVADAGNAIPETGGSDGVALNGRVAAKTITVIRPDLVVSALTGPIRGGARWHRGGDRDGQEPPGLARDRARLVTQVLSLRRSDARRRGRGAVTGAGGPRSRCGRRLDRGHDADDSALRDHGQQVHPGARRRARSGHRGPGRRTTSPRGRSRSATSRISRSPRWPGPPPCVRART